MALQTARRIGATITTAGTLTAGQHTPVDASAGNLTVTLPAGVTAGAHLSIEKRDTSTNTVTISGSIRGATATIALSWQYETITLRYDGTTWTPTEGHKTRASLDAAYLPATTANSSFRRITSRRVWAVGDSLTAGASTGGGGLTFDSALASSTGQPLLWLQGGSWVTWALLASGCAFDVQGVFATGGYTAAQILATHVPPVIAAATPGDTVVVLAGTNGNVLADTITIHQTLRAAGLHTIAATIPPSTSSTPAAIAAFNEGLKQFTYANDIPLADVNSALTDPATGAYPAAYNGDGIHPNQAGFQILGQTIASTITAVLPAPAETLINHNVSMANSLQSNPLAQNPLVAYTDYSPLAAIGTSTFVAGSVPAFRGGKGYICTRNDTDLEFKVGAWTLQAGHRYRLGTAMSFVPGTSPTWGARLESNTTGAAVLFGIGWTGRFTVAQGVTRFFHDFTVPTLPDYDYRLHWSLSGAGSVLSLGEITMFDLTAMGAA